MGKELFIGFMNYARSILISFLVGNALSHFRSKDWMYKWRAAAVVIKIEVMLPLNATSRVAPIS